MKRLDNLVTIVTGAASGIGAATARRFRDEGALLVLSDIQADKLAAIADELGATAHPADVTREDDIAALVDAAVARHGRLDCMINNAGQLGALGSIAEIDATDWARTLDVLLTSVFYGMKHAARVMRPARQGCILTTSSVGGLQALAPHAYTAAKHAVVGLTASVASELAAAGIRVNAVAPGNVPSAMTTLAYGTAEEMRARATERNPLHRVVESDEIAGAFAYLASRDGINVTGQVLTVDAGLTACRLEASYYARTAGD